MRFAAFYNPLLPSKNRQRQNGRTEFERYFSRTAVMTVTNVGVVGGGPRSAAFARALARAGVCAVISHEGWTDSTLSILVADLGEMVRVSTFQGAAEEDVVFLSVGWTQL